MSRIDPLRAAKLVADEIKISPENVIRAKQWIIESKRVNTSTMVTDWLKEHEIVAANDIVVNEKCQEDEASLKTAVLKIFKRGQVLVREEVRRRQNNKMVLAPENLSIDEPEAEE